MTPTVGLFSKILSPFLDTTDWALKDVLLLRTNCQFAGENIPDVKTHFPRVISYMMALALYQGLSGAGKGRLGLMLCCHVSPVPSVTYSTVLCTDSVTQADKERPSGSLCPSRCTTDNYHHHHPISGVFKWGKLICRLGAVPVTTSCMHTFATCIHRNGPICTFAHTAYTQNSAPIHLSSRCCSTEMRNLRHAHTHTQIHFDTSRLGCRGLPAVLFINICHHTGGSALLSRASPALQKLFIQSTLPFSAPFTSRSAIFCQLLLNTTGISI